MEERRDSASSSEGESVSGSPAPSLPSPPILPLQAAQQAHRTTNFFIDNILRPDFGCKKEHGVSARERAHTSGRERVSRPSLPGTPCQDSNCSTDSSASSASSASLASPKKSNNGTPCAAAAASAAAVSGGGSGVKAEERTGGAAAENNSSSLVVLNGSGAADDTGEPAAAVARLGVLHPVLGQALIWSKDPETEKVQEREGGQAAAHGVHGGAAAAAEDGVPGEPVHHRAAAAESGPGAEPERVPDQDLVPEQTGQDQEGQRLQERARAAAHGAGTVQPFHHDHPGGQGGQRLTGTRTGPGPGPGPGPGLMARAVHCKYIISNLTTRMKEACSSSSHCAGLCRTLPACAGLCRTLPACAGLCRTVPDLPPHKNQRFYRKTA
ncbi:Homeobox protein engrailed-1a [Larimichthys crocea]|uniref:Uncharacterized protein n=1 Tax=Larimichthys crocea TaxID=215358 RepID=A0ACD3QHG8_LARCR|nr:Homeobox protein engrailed-1a [Larimichthys crocea]